MLSHTLVAHIFQNCHLIKNMESARSQAEENRQTQAELELQPLVNATPNAQVVQ
jgi:hypothetical protein